MTTASLVVVLAYGLLTVGCSADDASRCADEPAPTTDVTSPDTSRLSLLRVESRAIYEETGNVVESTFVTLALADLSRTVVESRPPTPCCASSSCFLLTGQPVSSCRDASSAPCGNTTCEAGKETCVDGECVPCTDQPLEADAVSVDGLVGGTIALERSGLGAWGKHDVSAPIFGPDDISVTVTGRTESGFFPSYEQHLTPPQPLVLLSPDPSQQNSVGSGDLAVKWVPGNGDWMEARVQSTDITVRDAVVCIARDDGCMPIPVSAIETIKLDMKPEDKIKLSVQRVRTSTTQLEGDQTAAQVKAISRIDVLLAP